MNVHLIVVLSDLQITSSRHYISFIVKTPLPEDKDDIHNGKALDSLTNTAPANSWFVIKLNDEAIEN